MEYFKIRLSCRPYPGCPSRCTSHTSWRIPSAVYTQFWTYTVSWWGGGRGGRITNLGWWLGDKLHGRRLIPGTAWCVFGPPCLFGAGAYPASWGTAFPSVKWVPAVALLLHTSSQRTVYKHVVAVATATGYGLDGPGFQPRWGQSVQNGPEAHSVSCTMGAGSLTRR